MTEKYKLLIRDVVANTYSNNQDVVVRRLTAGTSEDEHPVMQTNKIISNSMLLSTEIACLIVFDVLMEAGVIEDKEIREQPDLKLVWDSSKYQHEDNQ